MGLQDQAPTIAIVDDDEAVQVSITSLLKSVGYLCQAYRSAEMFLDACAVQSLDCVILDFRLPGANGLDLQHHLTDLGFAIPIIMISAYADRVRSKALELGAVAVLGKPFYGETLLAVIRSALNRSRRRYS